MSESRASKSSKKREFDIFKHELVPKHEIVPVEEAIKILRELGVRPEQLPWIRASDPAVRAIGGKPGDIIRIIRKSPTAGEIVVYRYVIAG
ncbi:MAG: DNA-directed RNA polymerase subunit H [Sulfolobales archaeon]